MQMRSIAAGCDISAAPSAGRPRLALGAGIARLAIFVRAFLSRVRSRQKRLALLESVALGDRRFVSVIQFEGRRFLVGSAPSAVTLLAHLPDAGASSASGAAAQGEGESR
ncbi:MAG TPA: flagellar biosynthetic protein FliO [Terriglobales bacterium]|nr:flagellar biosynthetic protein FliO [Terriglobales bacterium]